MKFIVVDRTGSKEKISRFFAAHRICEIYFCTLFVSIENNADREFVEKGLLKYLLSNDLTCCSVKRHKKFDGILHHPIAIIRLFASV